jgi:hypothetical protein
MPYRHGGFFLDSSYNNALADAATDLGPPEVIRNTFVGFQRLLYQDPTGSYTAG